MHCIYICFVLVCFFLGACKNAIHEENLGHRFEIYGDFDGNGTIDTLKEYYNSEKTQKPLAKHYSHLNTFEALQDYIAAQNPYTFLASEKQNIDTFKLIKDAQSYGLLYLKNEGDLNGDGNDEISYVLDWLDYSALNTCYIASYKNKTWQILYEFEIWDWLVPPYAKVSPKDTAALKELKIEYKAFNGLVKKLDNNLIEVIHVNEDAEKAVLQVQL